MPTKLSKEQLLENARPRCLTCKYWKRVGVEKSEADFAYGACPKIWVAFNPETLSKVFNPLRSDMRMKTHQQFGCAMHRTPKTETKKCKTKTKNLHYHPTPLDW